MAKTKAAGASKLGRDSLPKYLGIKLYEGETAKTGQILIRQRGTKFIAGNNVKCGRDNTLYAIKSGKVHFLRKRKRGFNRAQRIVSVVSVVPS
jgi:large subunit ribosomal protein L27